MVLPNLPYPTLPHPTLHPTRWASQKFWLDNGLALAVCVSFACVGPAYVARTGVSIATTTFSQHTILSVDTTTSTPTGVDTPSEKKRVTTAPATSVFTTTTATHSFHLLDTGAKVRFGWVSGLSWTAYPGSRTCSPQ